MKLSARWLTFVLALAAMLTFEVRPAAAAPLLIISEFRLRGPNGALYEFIEIYNRANTALTIASATGSGFGVVASDGVLRCTIPNATVIPAHGHFLCVNTAGYSLGGYPAGPGAAATGDAGYTLDIPDNAGIAIFNNNAGAYGSGTRLDSVGSTAEANTLYREGSGYPALTALDIEYSLTRRLSANTYVDSNVNKADFLFVDTNGTSAGFGGKRGAPGPENLSSPVTLAGTATLTVSRLDECDGVFSGPNRVRHLASSPSNNSTYGTIDLRTTWTNNTGANITRLRFRVLDLSSLPAAAGAADLRPITAPGILSTVDRAPCGTGVTNVQVRGTVLETPPSQPEAGGLNSSLSVGVVTPAAPRGLGQSN
jgi:hypothetical protein